MVISELLNKGVTLIEGKEYSDPILESILVLSTILNVDRTYVYTHLDKEVSQASQERFISIMEKRKAGHPLQYLLKEKQFMGLDFYVEEGVLIPRPETEIMVEYIIDYIEKNYGVKQVNVLDIGIGSGAISLSIAKYLENTRVYGIDIGYIPIKVANINKDRFGLENVEFYQGDLFEPLESAGVKEKFHIIISNPPYIKSKDIEKLQEEVRNFEPMLALDGGEDGLVFYRKITAQSKGYLKSKGMLIYEIGYDQGLDVKEILIEEGFKDISILKDYQGHDRVVLGFK